MKLKALCAVFIFIILCGCGNSKVVTPVINNIDFTAQIKFSDEHYVCDVSVYDENIDVKVVNPQEIKGLTFHYSDSTVSVEHLGIKYTPDAGNMPAGGVAVILTDVINHINKEGLTAVFNEGNCVINSRAGEHKFTFEFSPAGLPLELEIPNINYTVKFNNVTIK